MTSVVETDRAQRSVPVTAQWISLWIALVSGAVLLVAFLSFPGFFPPVSPELPAEKVAAFYADDTAMIRFSMVVFNVCGVMLMPFFMVIVVQMKRMATPSQVLAYCYLSGAVAGVTLFAIADLMWLVAAFRPERDPQLILLLNDLAWIIFTAPVGMIVVQNLCLALAVRLDAQPRPIFPRWVAAFSVVIGLAIAPSAGAAAFRTGPLAWNGLVSFWLRIGAYALFVVVMFFVLWGAVRRQSREEEAAR
ncbi:hypothetical protein J4573_11315 [Actinomadura barringtoniae]|uniref:DUF4386 family protein n=1 Tax=Actinomadura barringtoniae TaxID=1427535 RepID=A0A939PED2_9ACTN|nr:hypothetical protein [Actinomadura barringtoniae]MBO2447679.1 hypothetical protein [Actinomadura barringtoniae]